MRSKKIFFLQLSLFKNDIRGSITLLPRVIMITLFSLSLRAADQREEEEEEEDVCVSRSALSRAVCDENSSPTHKRKVFKKNGLGFLHFFCFAALWLPLYYKGLKLRRTKTKRKHSVVVVNLSSPDACETRGSDTLRSPPPTGGTGTPLAW